MSRSDNAPKYPSQAGLGRSADAAPALAPARGSADQGSEGSADGPIDPDLAFVIGAWARLNRAERSAVRLVVEGAVSKRER